MNTRFASFHWIFSIVKSNRTEYFLFHTESSHDFGFTENILQCRLIGVCTNGISNSQGEMNEALVLLKNKIKIPLHGPEVRVSCQ